MQDLTLINIFLIALAAGVVFIAGFVLRIKFLHYLRQEAEKSLKRLRTKDLPLFYSSYSLKNDCLRCFFCLPRRKENRLALKAMLHPAAMLDKVQRAVRQEPRNRRLLLLLAQLSLCLSRRDIFGHVLQQIHLPFYVARPVRACFLHLSALEELYQTDMYSASSHCSQALKLFQKCGFVWEEAECYMTLAQIYRISGVYDVSFTMLKEAKKLWRALSVPAKEAEAEAYSGLIELGRENFSAAAEYLTGALEICRCAKLPKTVADVQNWLGLVRYLQKDVKSAAEAFEIAYAFSPQATAEARAFAAEMLSRINLKNRCYETAQKYASAALELYQGNNHCAGIFENLYLKAEIYYATADYEQSATVLTALIKEKTPAMTTYYPANAYTLLGLVNLKQNKINVARTLFKQAIDLENSHNRLKGAAIDYNNLAELSLRAGEADEARAYFKQALAYAEELKDDELCRYLAAKL